MFKSSAIRDWVTIGLSALSFIVIGKMLFVTYNVPVISNLFAAA